MADQTTSPSRLDTARHAWAGRRDGRRAARRLSHLGASTWIARRAGLQASLDAQVAELVETWTRAIEVPRGVVRATSQPRTEAVEDRARPPQAGRTMAEVRAERRRRAAAAVRAQAARARTEQRAAALSQLDTLTHAAASDIWHLQARHTHQFAIYTRAFLRSYSRAMTRHAPEPAWLELIARPEAMTLSQTLLPTGLGTSGRTSRA